MDWFTIEVECEDCHGTMDIEIDDDNPPTLCLACERDREIAGQHKQFWQVKKEDKHEKD